MESEARAGQRQQRHREEQLPKSELHVMTPSFFAEPLN